MRLWRIVSIAQALDKSCAGSKAHGGRWNPIGQGALYAGTTVEICALEAYVHLSSPDLPPMMLVAVDLPDDESLLFRPRRDELPDAWAALPVAAASQQFGRRWLEAGKELVMLVPSAIVPEALNAVINPSHPAYGHVQLMPVRPFAFDPRMHKR